MYTSRRTSSYDDCRLDRREECRVRILELESKADCTEQDREEIKKLLSIIQDMDD